MLNFRLAFLSIVLILGLSQHARGAYNPCEPNWLLSRAVRINMAGVGEDNNVGCFKFSNRDEFAWLEMMNEAPYRGWIAGYARKNGNGYTAWISAIPVGDSWIRGSFIANPNYFVIPSNGLGNTGGRPSLNYMAQLKGFSAIWNFSPVFNTNPQGVIEPSSLGQINGCGQDMANFIAYTEVGQQTRCAILDSNGDILMWYGFGIRGGRRDLHIGTRRSEIIGQSYGLTQLSPNGSYFPGHVEFGGLQFQKTAQGFLVTGQRQETWVRR